MDLSLALNTDVQRLTSNTGFKVNGAFDCFFTISQCTSFKLQGSNDGGSTWADLAGTSTPLGSSGTLTAANVYAVSLLRCRFNDVRAVFAGTNPSVVLVRHIPRQSPIVGLDRTKQITIVDPQTGTA